MATPATKVELYKLTINGKTMSPKAIEIRDGDLVEFHVVDFQGKKCCNVSISGIDYTDDGTTPTTVSTLSAVGTTTTGAVPLGTIKIGS
jgi:hypothetical protein